MSISNRSYLCIVCGQLRRLPLPHGLFHWASQEEQARRKLRSDVEYPREFEAPVPYGHWRSWVVGKGYELPVWIYHCGKPMFLLGRRASQAAAQIEVKDRLVWVALGCRVSEHGGAKRWRPILKEASLKDAYPLV